MLFNYQEFLDSIDRKAYHEGEWQWEEDGCTVTRTYNYTAPGCHDSCGILIYVKDGEDGGLDAVQAVLDDEDIAYTLPNRSYLYDADTVEWEWTCTLYGPLEVDDGEDDG